MTTMPSAQKRAGTEDTFAKTKTYSNMPIRALGVQTTQNASLDRFSSHP